MHHDQSAMALGEVEDFEHFAVIQLEVVEGHVYLKRCIAVANQSRISRRSSCSSTAGVGSVTIK
jgi:hypothetical protein